MGVIHLANEIDQLIDIVFVEQTILDNSTPRNAGKVELMAALRIEFVECFEVTKKVGLQQRLISNVLWQLYPVPLHLGGKGVLDPAAHGVAIKKDGD
jgi:hypothetical protein